jgi:hypothetical protein
MVCALQEMSAITSLVLQLENKTCLDCASMLCYDDGALFLRTTGLQTGTAIATCQVMAVLNKEIEMRLRIRVNLCRGVLPP